jgi:hypothetical protein
MVKTVEEHFIGPVCLPERFCLVHMSLARVD